MYNISWLAQRHCHQPQNQSQNTADAKTLIPLINSKRKSGHQRHQWHQRSSKGCETFIFHRRVDIGPASSRVVDGDQ